MQNKHPLADMLEPVIDGLGYETVRIITIGQANPTLQVMIDKTDGTEIMVDDCAKVSRALSEVLDANDPISGKYNLEVSSPGLDRPLTKLQHFVRFVGNEVKIETDTVVEGRKRFKGKIITLKDDDTIVFLMDEKEYSIPYHSVSKAKLVLTDELWDEYVANAQEDEQ